MLKTLVLILLVILIGAAALFYLRGDEDTWICQDGQWARHGNPSAPMPTEPCNGNGGNNNGNNNSDNLQDKIKVSLPQPNSQISTPLNIEGEARGSWYFEASFPVELRDANNNLVASEVAQAQGDWMTTEFVPFKARLEFLPSLSGSGFLILKKDNPSGLPQLDEELRVPVVFKPVESMQVKAFFNNSAMDPEFSCNKVFSVQREIPRTQAVARASLEELLKGPTAGERSQGFFTSINEGVKINSLTIQDGTARVDFNEQLEFQVGGSCRVSAIRSQITETLKQFSTVQNVIISINGRTEDILQP